MGWKKGGWESINEKSQKTTFKRRPGEKGSINQRERAKGRNDREKC